MEREDKRSGNKNKYKGGSVIYTIQEFLLFYELSNQIYEILSIFLFLVFADTTDFSKLFDGGGT